MGFAACALILSSCSQQEVTENIDQNNSQLQFSMAMGAQTRAAELTNEGLKGKATDKESGIALYAYLKDNSVWAPWYSDNLWWKNGKWNIESTRFRNEKESKYITFFPKNYVENGANLADATFSGASFPKFDCIIPVVNGEQKDLVAGITDVGADQKDITLTMRHILSQVNFGVYGYTGANIEIKDIKIHDVYNKATYTFRENEDVDQKPNIVGEWGSYKSFTAGSAVNAYNYLGTYFTVPSTAVTHDKYIFGDGGNWAVGPTSTSVWYHDPGKDGNDKWNNPANIADNNNPRNSLMLLPQDFNGKDAYVTFKYKIWDIGSDGNGTNAGYAAGSKDTYVDGRFKLDFDNSVNPVAYTSKWDQNYRYVYIIDFEKFLDDSKLDFTVDVEMYPWENYDNPGPGVVDVPVAGIPTNTQLNELVDGNTWYVATRSSTIVPTTDEVQLVATQTWDWANYTFEKIKNTGDKITIDFSNVIFNGKTLTISVPEGFYIYIDDEAIQQSVDVTANTDIVTIKRSAISNPAARLSSVASGAVYFVATGLTTVITPTVASPDLKDNQVWDLTRETFSGLTNTGHYFNIDFTNVSFNGKSITIKVPAGFKINQTPGIIDQQSIVVDGNISTTVTIERVGRVTEPTQLNNLNTGDVWYLSTNSTNSGTEILHIIANVTWDWSAVAFTTLGSTAGNNIKLDFSNVNFNGKKVTIKVPIGFKVYIGATVVDQQSVEVTAASQVVTIAVAPRVTEPTSEVLNVLAHDRELYIATGTTTTPDTESHITGDLTWNWSLITFDALESGDKIWLNPLKTDFNGYTITLILQAGFSASHTSISQGTGSVYIMKD